MSICVNYVRDCIGGAPTSNPHGLELAPSTPGTYQVQSHKNELIAIETNTNKNTMITINLDGRNYAIVSLTHLIAAQDEIDDARKLKNVSMTDVLATSIFASYYIDTKGVIHYVLKNNVVIIDDEYVHDAGIALIEALELIDSNFTWLSDFIKDFATKHNMTRSIDEIESDIISSYRHIEATELMIRVAAKRTIPSAPSKQLPIEDDELPF